MHVIVSQILTDCQLTPSLSLCSKSHSLHTTLFWLIPTLMRLDRRIVTCPRKISNLSPMCRLVSSGERLGGGRVEWSAVIGPYPYSRAALQFFSTLHSQKKKNWGQASQAHSQLRSWVQFLATAFLHFSFLWNIYIFKNRTPSHVLSNNGLCLCKHAQYVLLFLVLAVNSDRFEVTYFYFSCRFLWTLLVTILSCFCGNRGILFSQYWWEVVTLFSYTAGSCKMMFSRSYFCLQCKLSGMFTNDSKNQSGWRVTET